MGKRRTFIVMLNAGRDIARKGYPRERETGTDMEFSLYCCPAASHFTRGRRRMVFDCCIEFAIWGAGQACKWSCLACGVFCGLMRLVMVAGGWLPGCSNCLVGWTAATTAWRNL